MGLHEAQPIPEIVKGKEVTMRDEPGGTRDLTNEVRSLQKRKKLIRQNTEKLRRTRYNSPGPWKRPLEKGQNIQRNPHQNTNMPNIKIFGFGELPARPFSIETHTSVRTRWTVSNPPCPNQKDDNYHPSL